jgi:hypothetical protein
LRLVARLAELSGAGPIAGRAARGDARAYVTTASGTMQATPALALRMKDGLDTARFDSARKSFESYPVSAMNASPLA